MTDSNDSPEPSVEAVKYIAEVRSNIKRLISYGHTPDHIKRHFGFENDLRFVFNEDKLLALALDTFAAQVAARAVAEERERCWAWMKNARLGRTDFDTATRAIRDGDAAIKSLPPVLGNPTKPDEREVKG